MSEVPVDAPAGRFADAVIPEPCQVLGVTGAPPDADAFVCGDDEGAKAQGLALAQKLVTGRALDAGPLASARALEGLTAVIVNLNRRYKGHAGIRVTGLG